MNSRVKHAQKAGAPIEDIAAGVAYSVVKNALHRIIGDDRIPQPGQRVVVQGGTFRSDAVLRAFELLCGVEAVRPVQAHLMGAIGCALFALDEAGADTTARSGLVGPDELQRLEVRREKVTCTGLRERMRAVGRELRCREDALLRQRQQVRAWPRRTAAPMGRWQNCAIQPGRYRIMPPNVIADEQRLIASFGNIERRGVAGSRRIGLMDSMAL